MSESFPRKIGKYRILRELGRGGQCTVYLGHDPFTRRTVAVKVAPPAMLSDPVAGGRFRNRFLKEASLAGRLDHLHIVKIFDAVLDDDTGYIVMEYVSGGSLRQFCSVAKLLPVEKVVEIAFKCCQALDYANRHGVIHRDIKPANIMIHGDMDIKIADFGAAQFTLGDHTQFLGLVGSPAYMSPEQVRESGQTFKTDLYSLGVVMYELLTGRLPFLAENDFSLTYKIVNEEPVPIRVLRPGVPISVEAIVQRAMAKDEAQRFESWEDFAAALAATFGQFRSALAPLGETEKFNIMRRLGFFRDFSDVELWEALRFSYWRKFPAGRVLMKEGRIGSGVFLIVSGAVQTSRQGRVLGSLGKGDCFGEMSFIDPVLPRPVSAATVEDTVLIKIRARSLRQASEVCQQAFHKTFLKVLVTRLAQAEERLAGYLPEAAP